MSTNANNSTLVAAKIGGKGVIIGAIMGALLAGIFSFGTALVQNQMTNSNVAKQIAASKDGSEQDFLRAQRASSYSEYLAASLDLENAMSQYSILFSTQGSSKTINPSGNAEHFPVMKTSHRAFTTARFKMLMLISPDSEQAEQKLYNLLHGAFIDLVNAGEASLMGQLEPPLNNEIVEKVGSDFNINAFRLRNEFVKAARPDLGNFD